MEPAVLCSSSSRPVMYPIHSKFLHHPKARFNFNTGKRRSCSKISAAERDYDGRLIDESMIVLRKRIRQMKMGEKNDEVPSEWMEWEKQYVEHGKYDRDVCEAVGLLQSLLMNTRPSLAVGMVGLVLLSLPTSSVVVMSHLVELAKWVATAVHIYGKIDTWQNLCGWKDHDQAHHDGRSDGGGGGRLVDESMIVLRRRIREMKVAGRNYEPPSNWMKWEKEWYGSYNSVICGFLGILQSQLMNTRPSLGLGILALVAVSVPISTAVAASCLVDMMSTVVLSGIHPPT